MLSEIVRDAVEAQPDMKILHEARTLAELEATACPRADVIQTLRRAVQRLNRPRPG